MVYVPVRSIIPSLKLGYLSVQAHKPWSISHLYFCIGPGCSKLTTSLVNISLNVNISYMPIFFVKKIRDFF